MDNQHSGHNFDADIIMPLRKHHDVKSFDCGKPQLNDFLARRAMNSLVGSTYVQVSDTKSSEVIAYYTIAPDVTAIVHNPANPPLATIVRLEYLAVDRKYQSNHVGADILIRVMLEVAELSKIASINFLVLEPLDDDARKWFLGLKFGFVSAQLPHKCLAISIETILSMSEPEGTD